MKKRFSYLVLFLVAGLYIDIDTDFDWTDQWTQCNGSYLQRSVLVQTIVPFRPERENFYFGFGNKHFNYERSISISCGSWDKKYSVTPYEQGCHVSADRGMRDRAHFIDLMFWKSPVMDPTKYTIDMDNKRITNATREVYEQAQAELLPLDGKSCKEAR